MTFAGIPIFPDVATSLGVQVDWLMAAITALCGIVLGGVFAFMLFSIVKYRASAQPAVRPKLPPQGNKLEIIWTIVPLVLFLGMFGWGAYLFYKMHEVPANSTDVYVVGKQWMWKFEHPNGMRELNELHVPVGVPIRLVMTSQDVIHSFFVPEFRMKQDLLPGRYTYTWFQATKPGVYHLFCTQYCGLDHAHMTGKVMVLSKQDYQTWLSTGLDKIDKAGHEGNLVSRGQALYRTVGCIACHGENSPVRAPRLTGIFGTTVELRNGGKAVVDENYLHEKLVNPYAKDLLGFAAVMPSFDHLSQEDLMALVAYIKAGAPESEKGP